MKLIRALVGIVAVIFSIQPLMSWAARSSKAVTFAKPDSTKGQKPDSGGSPTCHGNL